MADLIPSRSSDGRRVEGAIAKILKARKHVVTNEELSELRNQGRK